jgi:hypothetical protein
MAGTTICSGEDQGYHGRYRRALLDEPGPGSGGQAMKIAVGVSRATRSSGRRDGCRCGSERRRSGVSSALRRGVEDARSPQRAGALRVRRGGWLHAVTSPRQPSVASVGACRVGDGQSCVRIIFLSPPTQGQGSADRCFTPAPARARSSWSRSCRSWSRRLLWDGEQKGLSVRGEHPVGCVLSLSKDRRGGQCWYSFEIDWLWMARC